MVHTSTFTPIILPFTTVEWEHPHVSVLLSPKVKLLPRPIPIPFIWARNRPKRWWSWRSYPYSYMWVVKNQPWQKIVEKEHPSEGGWDLEEEFNKVHCGTLGHNGRYHRTRGDENPRKEICGFDPIYIYI